MTDKHTLGPWRVEHTKLGTYVLAGNFCVATTADSRTGNVPPAMDNANFIVRACNSHADLLTALRLVTGWLDNDPDTLESLHDSLVSREIAPSNMAAVRELLDVARAAIANATK